MLFLSPPPFFSLLGLSIYVFIFKKSEYSLLPSPPPPILFSSEWDLIPVELKKSQVQADHLGARFDWVKH